MVSDIEPGCPSILSIALLIANLRLEHLASRIAKPQKDVILISVSSKSNYCSYVAWPKPPVLVHLPLVSRPILLLVRFHFGELDDVIAHGKCDGEDRVLAVPFHSPIMVEQREGGTSQVLGCFVGRRGIARLHCLRDACNGTEKKNLPSRGVVHSIRSNVAYRSIYEYFECLIEASFDIDPNRRQINVREEGVSLDLLPRFARRLDRSYTVVEVHAHEKLASILRVVHEANDVGRFLKEKYRSLVPRRDRNPIVFIKSSYATIVDNYHRSKVQRSHTDPALSLSKRTIERPICIEIGSLVARKASISGRLHPQPEALRPTIIIGPAVISRRTQAP
uniref:Uncharacterized protein n=1 Tax=Pristionchus pacificus TaxID=54126 RepID=A0A2A6BJC1_PRIPA|eukprot:PDM66014.1 hypothetical protein PRIPAC_44108 [Pristionchus pacificus]